MRLRALMMGLSISLMATSAFSLNTLFYLRGASRDSVQVYREHADKISVIAPQVYNVEENGTIAGAVPKEIIDIAKKYNTKIIPVAVNMWFSRPATHRFLLNPKAQAIAIAQLVQKIKQNKFEGIQVDFEGMPNSDRQRFTRFYQKLSQQFHRNHLKVSVAIAALSDISPKKSVYDIAALAVASDFVTLMTYDEHWRHSSPGPIASTGFGEENIELALKYLPANKISFGIPTYGYKWQSSSGLAKFTTYKNAEQFLARHDQAFKWDKKAEVPYASFKHGNVKYTIYAENVRSFNAKLALAKKYKLHGISVWCLNDAVHGIWQKLPSIS